MNTLFHHSHVELQKWFIVISLILNAKKGLSAYQISRDIGLRRTTVWKMMHKIRKAMGTIENELLKGIIEMDETYLDAGNSNNSHKRGRGTDKEVVSGMVERKGKIKVKHSKNKNIKAFDLRDLVRKNIQVNQSVLITDEFTGYSRMNEIIKHFQINHSKCYVNGSLHTNTIESFWAILKRGILGKYHKVSTKYLSLYLNEFKYRYNNRNNKNIFESFISRKLM